MMMSTWQQELYVQVQVRIQVLQNCTRVQVQSTKYASETITISTTNCHRLDNCINSDMYNFFSVSDNENLWHLRHVLGIPSV